MRRSKAEIRQRVNGNLRVEFSGSNLTSYAGLELLRRFFGHVDLNERIRRHLGGFASRGDFGGVSVIRLIVVLLALGARRIRHLEFVRNDPLVKRASGLSEIPNLRTVRRWLKRFRSDSVGRLRGLNSEIVLSALGKSGLRTVTVDVDGTVVSTGLKVGGALRGYNPHQRKVASYYPITAHIAETGHLLRVKNRYGNVHDGVASIPFLREVLSQLTGYKPVFRMDGAFFLQPVIRLLNRHRAGFAIKVPFWTWLNIKERIAEQDTWQKVDPEVEYFEMMLKVKKWDDPVRTVVYRKKVRHKTRKNYQLDLFDPNDGHYEYSAIATNQTIDGRRLWRLMCGRGNHEKVLSELKSGLAFDCVPTNHYSANSAWQQLSALTYNLLTSFQIDTGAPRKPRTWKRTTLHVLKRVATLRFEIFQRAGMIVRPAGQTLLRVNQNNATKQLYERISAALNRRRAA